MRIDKLTTKFQEALGEAQSLALGKDNAYIEPAHVLSAMLRQDDGPRALLQRAGVNVQGLLAAARLDRFEAASGEAPHQDVAVVGNVVDHENAGLGLGGIIGRRDGKIGGVHAA